jgi:ribosomal protein L15
MLVYIFLILIFIVITNSASNIRKSIQQQQQTTSPNGNNMSVGIDKALSMSKFFTFPSIAYPLKGRLKPEKKNAQNRISIVSFPPEASSVNQPSITAEEGGQEQIEEYGKIPRRKNPFAIQEIPIDEPVNRESSPLLARLKNLGYPINQEIMVEESNGLQEEGGMLPFRENSIGNMNALPEGENKNGHRIFPTFGITSDPEKTQWLPPNINEGQVEGSQNNNHKGTEKTSRDEYINNLAQDDEILLSKGDFEDSEDVNHKITTSRIENIESQTTLVQNATEGELNRLQPNIVSVSNDISNNNNLANPESNNKVPIEARSENPLANPPNNNTDEERREAGSSVPVDNNHFPQPTEKNEEVDERSFRPPPICNDGYLADIPDNRVTTPRAVCNDDFLAIVNEAPKEPSGTTNTAQNPAFNATDSSEKGNKEPLLKKKPRNLAQSASTPIKMYVIANKYRDKLFLLPMPRKENSAEVEVVTIFKKGKRERTQNTRPKRIRGVKEDTTTTPKNRREKVKATRRSR